MDSARPLHRNRAAAGRPQGSVPAWRTAENRSPLCGTHRSETPCTVAREGATEMHAMSMDQDMRKGCQIRRFARSVNDNNPPMSLTCPCDLPRESLSAAPLSRAESISRSRGDEPDGMLLQLFEPVHGSTAPTQLLCPEQFLTLRQAGRFRLGLWRIQHDRGRPRRTTGVTLKHGAELCAAARHGV